MPEKLERSLSLVGCVGAIVGLVIGASIFVLIPTLAGMTGPSLYLAYAISVVPAIFAALYLMQLGGALPVTGANYVAVTRWISPAAGVVIVLTGIIAMISTNCIAAWGFGEYIVAYFPNISVLGVAIGVVVLFGVINWLGVKIFQWTQVLMVVLLLLAMFIFGITGLFHIQPEFQAPLFPEGIGSFFLVVAIATFSWAGFIAITEVAGEVRNPKRNIPVALILSIVIILIIYILQTYVFTGTLLWTEAAEIGPVAVLAAAANFLPEGVVAYIAIAALLAMATTINSIMLLGAREAFALSRDQVMPSFFNRVHSRFKTPYLTIFLITVLSVVGVIFAAGLEQYALMVVFALMITQSFGATAVWRMPKRAPDLYAKALFRFTPFWRRFTWIGCLLTFSLIFLFGLLADLKTGLVFFGIMLLGIVYWYWRKSYLQKRGIDIHKNLRSFSKEVITEIEES